MAEAAIVFLGEVTASAAASIDVTGLDTFGATYDQLFLVLSGIRPSTTSGVNILMRMQQGGTWQTAGYLYTDMRHSFSGNLTQGYSSSDSSIPFGGTGVLNTSAKNHLSGRVFMDQPAVKSTVSYQVQAFGPSHSALSGYGMRDNTPAALQGLRIYASSGNVSGTVRLYGISNA